MQSPIKTVITNKTNGNYTITCIPRKRITLPPKGSIKLDGDAFSQCENSRSVLTLLDQIAIGNIGIHFIVDSAFDVVSSEKILPVSEAVLKRVAVKNELLKDLKSEDLDKEETPAEKPKQEEKPAEDLKKEEAPTEETKQEEKPAEALKKEEAPTEEPKQEEKPAEELTMAEAQKEEEKTAEAAEQAPAKSAEKAKAPKKVQVK